MDRGRSLTRDAEDGSEYTGSYTTGEASATYESTSVSDLPTSERQRQEIRAEVESLVRLVVPDEVDNIDAMMAQFRNREDELLQTLKTMQERSVATRARAAVHRSRSRPPPRRDNSIGGYKCDGAYSIDSRQTGDSETSRGSAAGSAAFAAASVPRPATGRAVLSSSLPAYESSDGESHSTNLYNTETNIRSTSSGSDGNLRGPENDSDSESG